MPVQKTNLNRLLLRHLYKIALLLTTISCQNSNELFLSQKEQNWLKNNEGKIEILQVRPKSPFNFTIEKGDYDGLIMDYQKEIENSLNLKFVSRNFDTWEKLINYSKTAKNYIIIGCARTIDREQYLSFTNSIVKIPYVIITQKKSPVSTMDSLGNKSICTVTDFAINDYLHQYYPNITPINFNSNIECIRAVSSGTCDAVIVNQLSVNDIIKKNAINNLKISGESGYINRLAIAISKNDLTFFKIVDKLIDNIPDERHKEIYEKWIHITKPLWTESP